jgi:ATP/ADP translocase
MENAGPENFLIQIIPSMVLGAIYAWIVFVIAKKRRINPWGWTIGSLVPIVGLIVAGVFYLLSFLSVLDRLNALEGEANF